MWLPPNLWMAAQNPVYVSKIKKIPPNTWALDSVGSRYFIKFNVNWSSSISHIRVKLTFDYIKPYI